MDVVGSGFGDDVDEAGGTVTDVGGDGSGIAADFLDGVDVEVGESRAAEFGIAGIDAVHGKDGRGGALAVDGELGGEIGGAVGVGLGSGGEQQELAEVALIEGERGHLLAGQELGGRRFGMWLALADGRRRKVAG